MRNMKTDILRLSCVFGKYRITCHKTYGLDPAHYYTLPGWDCMPKLTDCKLESLQDVNVQMFLETKLCGGISVCSDRYGEAGNLYNYL